MNTARAGLPAPGARGRRALRAGPRHLRARPGQARAPSAASMHDEIAALESRAGVPAPRSGRAPRVRAPVARRPAAVDGELTSVRNALNDRLRESRRAASELKRPAGPVARGRRAGEAAAERASEPQPPAAGCAGSPAEIGCPPWRSRSPSAWSAPARWGWASRSWPRRPGAHAAARPGARGAGAARERIAAALERPVAKGRMTAEEAEAIVERIEPVADVAALAPCAVVIEAAPERLELKHELFAALAAAVAPRLRAGHEHLVAVGDRAGRRPGAPRARGGHALLQPGAGDAAGGGGGRARRPRRRPWPRPARWARRWAST